MLEKDDICIPGAEPAPNYYCQGLTLLAAQIAIWRTRKGFACPNSLDTEEQRDMTLGKLMLIVTEVAEAAEAVRHNDWSNFAEELADTLIRVLDLSSSMNIDIAMAVFEKMQVNEGRPDKHGKETSL